MSEPTPPTASSTLEYVRPLPERAPSPPKPRYWLHLLLLLATCFTTLVMGARMEYNFQHGQPALSVNDDSLPFFFLAHEMGHYLYCRRYGVYATLPFFIPVPTPIGTMGAVILIRSRIRSRTALFDIGIAGPIAGFVVALAVLIVSLAWSRPMRFALGPEDYQLGYPLIFHVVHRFLVATGLVHGASALP